MDPIATSEILQVAWSIAIGALGATSCALLGCFLVLRRLSLLGDAIGHGVLPGIAVAVLLTGQLGGITMILCAAAFGLFTAFLSQTLTSAANVTEDSSLGVSFTTLFAIGVVIISVFMPGQHIDVDCILLGNFTNAVFVTVDWWGVEIPRAAPNMLVALVLTVAFLGLFWKELKITSFDASLAAAMGYPATAIHYLFVAMVAMCSVAAFEAMGSILVLAMLVVPPSTAHLLTDRLSAMLAWAAGLACTAAALGYLLASRWVFDCNVAGMIATVAGGQFFLAVLFAPRHGVVARLVRQWRLALRIAGEEILGSLYRAEEADQPPQTAAWKEHALPAWLIRLAFVRLRFRGWITKGASDGWNLTELGRQQAESIVRSHRLWEAFLGANFELPLDHLHAPAARIEHFIGPELQTKLATELQKPGVDPHGKQIP